MRFSWMVVSVFSPRRRRFRLGTENQSRRSAIRRPSPARKYNCLRKAAMLWSALETTSAEGTVTFRAVPASGLQVRVLAAGFAAKTSDVHASADAVSDGCARGATATETVVVTATRSSGSDRKSQLTATSALEHVRSRLCVPWPRAKFCGFFPERCSTRRDSAEASLTLFVRGGDSRYNKVIVDGVPVNDPGGTFDFGVIPMTDIGSRGVCARGAEHAVWLRRDDERSPDVVANWDHAST